MKNINKEIVPDLQEDFRATHVGDKLVRYNMGKESQVYLFHETEMTMKEDEEVEQTRAMIVIVENPVTRAKVIDAVEKAAYNLFTAEDVASYAASLARKSRIGEDPEQVAEHDQLIADTKIELNKLDIVTL